MSSDNDSKRFEEFISRDELYQLIELRNLALELARRGIIPWSEFIAIDRKVREKFLEMRS